MIPAATVAATTAPIHPAASASASSGLGANTPTAADGPDSCHVDKDCPGRSAKIEGVFPPVIAQRCCLQPGTGGAQDHLACQDAHGARPCVVVCTADADCAAPEKCKPWGKDHRRACAP